MIKLPYNKHMKDLYKRLRPLGFSQKFLKSTILPDWWDDSLAENPFNRSLAETAIHRHLGFPLKILQAPDRKLTLPSTGNVRYKRRRDTSPNDLKASALLAQRVAKLLRKNIDIVPFNGPQVALDIRNIILAERTYVDLESLVNFCWDNGIAVVHIDFSEFEGRKFQGLAMYVDQAPVIVLGHGSDAPAWLAFHLAHELGHIMLEHVTPDEELILDCKIDTLGGDDQEEDADAFATQILAGKAEVEKRPILGMTAKRLATLVVNQGPSHGIDPGSLALMYGRSAERIPVAQSALKFLGHDTGAKKIIAEALNQHINNENIIETNLHFLEQLTAIHS